MASSSMEKLISWAQKLHHGVLQHLYNSRVPEKLRGLTSIFVAVKVEQSVEPRLPILAITLLANAALTYMEAGLLMTSLLLATVYFITIGEAFTPATHTTLLLKIANSITTSIIL